MWHLIEKNCKIKWKSVHFGVLKMTINDQIWLFSDFDSFEKLNLMSKLATMKLLISLVWNWNLLLSLLWLKDRCCITTQKSCSQTHSLGTFSMYFGIKLLFLRNPSDNSLVVEAMVGFFWFISVQINHKNSFSYHFELKMVKLFFSWTDSFFKGYIFALFSVSFMIFLKFWLLWILFWKVRSFYLRNIIFKYSKFA